MIHHEKIYINSYNKIKDLSINDLVDVNLFVGRHHDVMRDLLDYVNNKLQPKNHTLWWSYTLSCVGAFEHYTEIEEEISGAVDDYVSYKQIFMTTQSLDAIKSFVKVAKENPQYKFALHNIGIGRLTNGLMSSSYTMDEVEYELREGLEVR